MPFKIYKIAFQTLVYKEINRFMRIWIQTILPPLITIGLYFLIFGHLIGSRMTPIGNIPYITYLAPGLIMMTVVNNAYTNVCASLFSMRFQKSIEELLVAPLPNALLLLGFITGGVARALMTGLLVTLLALCFTNLRVAHPLIMLAILPSTAALFASAGFTNALFAKKFDDISIVPTFILTPLTYLGGVFYSVELLPPFWQSIALVNPLLYVINTFRYAFLGISDINISYALLTVWIACILLFSFNLYLLNKGKGIRS